MDFRTKMRTFIARAKTGSVTRMLDYAKTIHARSGIPTPVIAADMAWCVLGRGIGYMEYLGYGFAGKPAKVRDTFMNMTNNIALVREVNDPVLRQKFEDKEEFLGAFEGFVGRDWMSLRQAPPPGRLSKLLQQA